MNNPHDKFFKKSISKKETAKGFLKHYLPNDLLAKIDLNTLQIEKDSFTNEELEEYFSDTVYKAKLDEKESYFCFLFEHKSYPDAQITLQLLKYMLRIWELKKEQKTEKLPLIVPLLIYHGRDDWNIGVKLSDIVEVIPPEAEEYLPDFKYILFDLSSYSKEEIKGTGQMRVFIDVLSAVFQDDFEEKFHDAISVLKQLEEQNKAIDYFQTVVKYIMEADAIDTNLEEVTKIVNRVSKEKEGEIMSIAEELRKEEREKARKEKLKIAKNLLDMGMNIHQISEATELNEEQIKKLKRKSQH